MGDFPLLYSFITNDEFLLKHWRGGFRQGISRPAAEKKQKRLKFVILSAGAPGV
jgi:phosphatidate phosphatase APP1